MRRILVVGRSLRAALRTVTFVWEVLPTLPSAPLDRVTAAPRVERVAYPTSTGAAQGDLYLPAGDGPHPGMVVCLGVVPIGIDHPQVPRLGRALARAGFATLLYWSPAMRDLRLDPDDAEGIAMAYRWLIDQPMLDPARSGLLGTCVGGTFALLAAARPSIRDRVAFVMAWAPFASMQTLARDISTATVDADGALVPWAVDQLTRKVFVRSLTSSLDKDEAARLRASCASRCDQGDPGPLSQAGRSIYPLLTALDVHAAELILEHLPAEVLEPLEAMSPIGHLADIHAPLVILAHDRDDTVIPVGESRRLVAALSGRPGVRYTEFAMFKHLDPTKVRLPPLALARELAKFVRSVYPIFRQAA